MITAAKRRAPGNQGAGWARSASARKIVCCQFQPMCRNCPAHRSFSGKPLLQEAADDSPSRFQPMRRAARFAAGHFTKGRLVLEASGSKRFERLRRVPRALTAQSGIRLDRLSEIVGDPEKLVIEGVDGTWMSIDHASYSATSSANARLPKRLGQFRERTMSHPFFLQIGQSRSR